MGNSKSNNEVAAPPPSKKRKVTLDGSSDASQSASASAKAAKESEQKLVLIQRSNYIVQTIQLTLKFGRDLIDSGTFLMLCPVLTDQLTKGVVLRDELMFTAYFEKYLTPTLVGLANTTRNTNMWNELNKRILALCGNRKAIVRSAAVDALLGLFSLMGHSWLNCLPQTLQHIHELLQDDDEDVLQRTKTLVQRIELLTSSKLNQLT